MEFFTSPVEILLSCLVLVAALSLVFMRCFAYRGLGAGICGQCPPTLTSSSLTTLSSLALIIMISAALLIPTLALIGRMHATPIIPTLAHNVSSLAETSHSPACSDINHCRTLPAIVYGCLVTIFACTWLSFHPDIPNCTYTLSRIRAHHFFSVMWSFLVPELVIMKAAIQWWRVRRLTPKLQRKFQGMC